MPPLLPERQIEQWTSTQIVRFFAAVGVECKSYPITTRVEDLIPADAVFGGGSMVCAFGLQYKALYAGTPPFWPLNTTQHRNLKAYSWIYYGLSELSEADEADTALHALWLAHPSFRYRSRFHQPHFSGHHRIGESGPKAELYRWYDFFLALKEGNVGAAIEDEADLINMFGPVWDHDKAMVEATRITDYFAINFDDKVAVRYTSLPL